MFIINWFLIDDKICIGVSSTAHIIISFSAFRLGDGQTDGNDNANCKAQVTGTNDQNTQATKVFLHYDREKLLICS